MGHCFISSTITFLVAGTYYNPTIPQLLDLFTLKDFMMVSVTNLWIGKTYGHIFRHLLEEKDMLAVAIYRKTTSDDAECTHPAGVEGAPRVAVRLAARGRVDAGETRAAAGEGRAPGATVPREPP